MMGIYRITNTANGKYYIGSSISLDKRFRDHVNALRRGKHENEYLQNAWNKYGEGCFLFEVEEEIVNRDDLLIREQWYLDNTQCLDRSLGYNIRLSANSTMLSEESKEKIRKARLGSKATEATRRLMSSMRKGKPLPKNSKPLSENSRARKVGQYDLNGSLIKEWSCAKEAQDHLGIMSGSSICGVCAGRHKSSYGYIWKYHN